MACVQVFGERFQSQQDIGLWCIFGAHSASLALAHAESTICQSSGSSHRTTTIPWLESGSCRLSAILPSLRKHSKSIANTALASSFHFEACFESISRLLTSGGSVPQALHCSLSRASVKSNTLMTAIMNPAFNLPSSQDQISAASQESYFIPEIASATASNYENAFHSPQLQQDQVSGSASPTPSSSRTSPSAEMPPPQTPAYQQQQVLQRNTNPLIFPEADALLCPS